MISLKMLWQSLLRLHIHLQRAKQSSGWVDRSSLEVVADRFADAIVDMLKSRPMSVSISLSLRELEGSEVKGESVVYFGDGALISKRSDEHIIYRGSAPKGQYRVYRWVVGRDYRNQRIDKNRWELIQDLSHSKDGEFEVVVSSTGRGDVFDLIKVVKATKK